MVLRVPPRVTRRHLIAVPLVDQIILMNECPMTKRRRFWRSKYGAEAIILSKKWPAAGKRSVGRDCSNNVQSGELL